WAAPPSSPAPAAVRTAYRPPAALPQPDTGRQRSVASGNAHNPAARHDAARCATGAGTPPTAPDRALAAAVGAASGAAPAGQLRPAAAAAAATQAPDHPAGCAQ